MFSAPAAVTEKASERCQVGDRKANTSELRSNVESTQTTSKPAGDVAIAPSRDGAVRSSAEIAVMAGERRSGVIRQAWGINRGTGRNPA
jgi:hypothetical protein